MGPKKNAGATANSDTKEKKGGTSVKVKSLFDSIKLIKLIKQLKIFFIY